MRSKHHVAAAMLCIGACFSGAGAFAQGSFAQSSAGSSAGVQIGEIVQFRGVGLLFYAGRAGADIYFSMEDEPGAYRWANALSACAAKGPGWRLPSQEELNLLYLNGEAIELHAKEINAQSGTWYWSATEHNESDAMRQRFLDGLQQPHRKRFAARVRCVRGY